MCTSLCEALCVYLRRSSLCVSLEEALCVYLYLLVELEALEHLVVEKLQEILGKYEELKVY